MKISTNLLTKFVNLPHNQTDLENLFETLTIRTCEINEIINLKSNYDNIVIGKILNIDRHPNADKLQITQTSVGNQTLQIICGATNIYPNQLVAVALPGAKIKWHGQGDYITLAPAKIRGVESYGMICAAEEIGIKSKVDGIMDLSHLNCQPGTPFAEATDKNDFIIDVDNKGITHRPDLWSHLGIARELAAILDEQLKHPNPNPKFPKTKLPTLNVKIQDEISCPRYQAIKLTGIKIEPSPTWLKNTLENLGHRSINNIVDATNLVMLELGNPLHAFDSEKITNETIIVRRAQTNETITTLDGEQRKLTDNMLVIADEKNPIALAGVIGGLDSGITDTTTSIILESANFNPISIRKTSKHFQLRTEASARYEKSLDPNLTEIALNRLIELIQTLVPTAKIASAITDINHTNEQELILNFNLDRASSKIGINFDEQTAKNLLEKIEFKVKPGKKNQLKVTVPTFRATRDISIEEDLNEELARLYGYEKIPATLPKITNSLPIINFERKLKSNLRQILSYNQGFHEISNYSFYSLKTLTQSKLNESNHLTVKNYLSEDQTHLRTSLVPNLLQTIHQNLKHFDQFKLYEFGHIFIDQQQFYPIEVKHLCGAVVLPSKSDPAFYHAKGAIEAIITDLNLQNLTLKRATTPYNFAHPGQFAIYEDNQLNEPVIKLYTLHPEIAHNFDLNNCQIAIFEINHTHLSQMYRTPKTYKEIPKFPAIELDISTLIPHDTEIQTIQTTIANSDTNLIKSTQLIDLYTGEKIPKDKKSATFKIIIQSDQQTLTDQQMHQIQQTIFKNLKSINIEIRGL